MPSKRSLLLLAAAAACLCTCQPDPLEQLIEESPFRSAELPESGDRIFVSVTSYPLELPGRTDITAWPFWHKYPLRSAHLAQSLDPNRPGTALSAAALRAWTNTGFKLAAADITRWDELRAPVVAAGGRLVNTTLALFRKPADVTEVAANYLDRRRVAYLSDGDGDVTEIEFAPGRTFFQLSCALQDPNSPRSGVSLGLRPAWQSPKYQHRFYLDQDGSPVSRMEKITNTLDQLHLQLNLPEDCFLALAAEPNHPGSPNLADLMLTRVDEEAPRQIILLIVPAVQTAEQIRQLTEKPD